MFWISIINRNKPSIDIEALYNWKHGGEGIEYSNEPIEGGGIYTDAFTQYLEHYKQLLKRLGFKMSENDLKAFNDAISKLQQSEDKLQNYFTQYKYIVDNYKDIKSKLEHGDITEEKLKDIKKKIAEANNTKNKHEEYVIKMIKIMDNYPKYIITSTNKL